MKLAEKYEALLARLSYRPHPVRMQVLHALCASTGFIDVDGLVERMQSPGASPEKEKVRMIVKRLNESGFLERQNVAGQNKLLFRLKEYAQLEQEVDYRTNNKHQ